MLHPDGGMIANLLDSFLELQRAEREEIGGDDAIVQERRGGGCQAVGDELPQELLAARAVVIKPVGDFGGVVQSKALRRFVPQNELNSSASGERSV